MDRRKFIKISAVALAGWFSGVRLPAPVPPVDLTKTVSFGTLYYDLKEGWNPDEARTIEIIRDGGWTEEK